MDFDTLWTVGSEPAPRMEKETRFRLELDIGSAYEKVAPFRTVPGPGKRSLCVRATDVTDAIAKADAWCNENYPGHWVKFSIGRNPKPEGGYDF